MFLEHIFYAVLDNVLRDRELQYLAPNFVKNLLPNLRIFNFCKTASNFYGIGFKVSEHLYNDKIQQF